MVCRRMASSLGACLSQPVNGVAPFTNNEDGILPHTIYDPYVWALKYAHGRALSIAPEGPSYEVATLGKPIEAIGLAAPGFGDVPYLDMVATHDKDKNTAALFIMNRDLEKEQDLEIAWHDLTPTKVLAFERSEEHTSEL